MFLKRSQFGHIQSEDLFLGAILNVYSRQVKIVEYGDVFTRNELEGKKSRTLALVKPDAYPHLGKIIAEVYKMNFIIAQMRMVKMTKADAEEFFAAEKGQPYFADLVAHMTSDVVTALEVVGKSAHAPRAIRRGQGREERYPRKQKHHGRTERNRVLLRPQVADNGDLQQLHLRCDSTARHQRYRRYHRSHPVGRL